MAADQPKDSTEKKPVPPPPVPGPQGTPASDAEARVEFQNLETAPVPEQKPDPPLELIKDINLKVRVELGRCTMFVEDVLKLSPGKIVEMDRLTGDPLDLYVNDQLVARGEVLVINDNFAIRITEIVNPAKH